MNYFLIIRFFNFHSNFIETHSRVRTTLSLQVNTRNFMIPSVLDTKFIHIA
jgi:hypothetical protein